MRTPGCALGVVVWYEPALPRALNSKRKCLSSCLSSDEWRAALLPLLESSQASNSGTQDLGCFQFGVFGLFKKKKPPSDVFSFALSSYIRQAAFSTVRCVIQIIPGASGTTVNCSRDTLGVCITLSLPAWVEVMMAPPQIVVMQSSLLLVDRSCETSEKSGID